MFQPLFSRIAEAADVLLLAGDLTDSGLPEEARVLARELGAARMPTAAVLGNHDVESDQAGEITKILTDAGVTVLDGEACELHGIGIAGVKGFGGGFGPRALGPWGETHHQAVRPRGGERGAQARGGPGAAPNPADDRAAALRARPADRCRRAARNLSVRRIEPARGANRPLPRVAGRPRARPPRPARRAHPRERAGLQRLDSAPGALLSRHAPVPCVRRDRRRAREPAPPRDAAAATVQQPATVVDASPRGGPRVVAS